MNPFVSKTIEATIMHTTQLLEEEAVSWSCARLGVFRIMKDLSARYPMQKDNIARRLGGWIAEQDSLRGVGAAADWGRAPPAPRHVQ